MNDIQYLAEFDALSTLLLEGGTKLRDQLGTDGFDHLCARLRPLRAEAEDAATVESIEAVVNRCIEILHNMPRAAELIEQFGRPGLLSYRGGSRVASASARPGTEMPQQTVLSPIDG